MAMELSRHVLSEISETSFSGPLNLGPRESDRRCQSKPYFQNTMVGDMGDTEKNLQKKSAQITVHRQLYCKGIKGWTKELTFAVGDP